MQLLCRLPHMAGQTMVVGGSEYHIDTDGLVTGLSREHADRLLLQADAWQTVGSAKSMASADDSIPAFSLPEGEELQIPQSVQTVTPVRRKPGRPKKADRAPEEA